MPTPRVFHPAPQCARWRVRYTMTGLRIDMTGGAHSLSLAPFNQGDVSALCNAIHTRWIADLNTAIAAAATLEEVQVTALDAADSPQATIEDGVTVGGSAVNPLPPSVAVVASIKTDSRSRSGHGRIYFSPLTTDYVDVDGTPKATIVTAIQGGFDNFKNHVNSDGLARWELAVISYFSTGARRANGIPLPWISIGVDKAFRSQDRREPLR